MTIQVNCKSADSLPIDRLLEFQGDLKKLTKANREKLQKSIERHGFIAPIFVWDNAGDFMIIDGHQRLATLLHMRQKGFSLPMIPVDYIKADNEADARDKLLHITSQYGEFNVDELKAWLDDIDGDIFDSVRFADDELKIIIDTTEDTKNDDEFSDDVEPITNLGDLWELGGHRLLCGDSTDADSLFSLCGDQKAVAVITDPPYNIDYGNIKHPKFKQRSIENDNMDREEFANFCGKFADRILEKTRGCIYVWGHPGPDGRIMFRELDSRFHCSTTIVWNKDQFTLGRGKYQNKYEPCWFGWVENGSRFSDSRNLVNVWDLARPKKSEDHPTMKPVALIERCINDSTLSGDLIIDLFLGSGTTIIAAEITGRICYGLELDPHYCDVIVNRFCTWMEENNREYELKLNGEVYKWVVDAL